MFQLVVRCGPCMKLCRATREFQRSWETFSVRLVYRPKKQVEESIQSGRESGLYDTAYANFAAEVYHEVRLETYGEDFGQTSWVITEESREIPKLLDLNTNSSVLEVGCGSGGYALYLVPNVGCSLVGLDVNTPRFAMRTNLRWRKGSVRGHVSRSVTLQRRPKVLCEMFRVLKPGGRMLFSDALVVRGDALPRRNRSLTCPQKLVQSKCDFSQIPRCRFSQRDSERFSVPRGKSKTGTLPAHSERAEQIHTNSFSEFSCT